MKNGFLLSAVFIITSLQIATGQVYRQNLHGPLFYEAHKGIQFNVIKFQPGSDGGFKQTLSTDFKLSPTKFFFKIVSTRPHPDKNEEYKIVEISFPNYVLDSNRNLKKATLDTSALYISQLNNGDVFWMREDVFNDLVKNRFIRQYYRRRYVMVAHGAVLSLPFKMRPPTADRHTKITPEFNLGGYVGPKLMLSRYEDFSLTIPFTVGISGIGVNEDNTINENPSPDQKTKDALILGRTISVGVVIQRNQFQVGFIWGWDRASGELGKQWIYNDKVWHSFSIGFTFFDEKSN